MLPFRRREARPDCAGPSLRLLPFGYSQRTEHGWHQNPGSGLPLFTSYLCRVGHLGICSEISIDFIRIVANWLVSWNRYQGSALKSQW
jgi:hypothetical protein